LSSPRSSVEALLQFFYHLEKFLNGLRAEQLMFLVDDDLGDGTYIIFDRKLREGPRVDHIGADMGALQRQAMCGAHGTGAKRSGE